MITTNVWVRQVRKTIEMNVFKTRLKEYKMSPSVSVFCVCSDEQLLKLPLTNTFASHNERHENQTFWNAIVFIGILLRENIISSQ